MNKPIFVVGAPRSGTSILTWCLGQHSNILAQEESNWLGRLAVHLEEAYRTGTERGDRSQLNALGVRREVFFGCFGEAINRLILGQRADLTRIAREQALAAADQSHILPAFKTERSEQDPKKRWVDGTPEYSFYVCGLRKLFPQASFIHILREPVAVVRSILQFARISGRTLAENEEQAYDYWLRAVRACVQAERAYGSRVVYRVFYSDLVAKPEATLAKILNYLQENYEPACLEPLQHRINSSNVPWDFELGDPGTDQKVVEAARQLEAELMADCPQIEPSPDIAAELEADFQKKAHHNQHVNANYRQALQKITKLEKELEELNCTRTRGGPVWERWTDRKRPTT